MGALGKPIILMVAMYLFSEVCAAEHTRLGPPSLQPDFPLSPADRIRHRHL